jgi:hypothetical protein
MNFENSRAFIGGTPLLKAANPFLLRNRNFHGINIINIAKLSVPTVFSALEKFLIHDIFFTNIDIIYGIIILKDTLLHDEEVQEGRACPEYQESWL